MASSEQLKRDPYEKSYSSLCMKESLPKKNRSPRPKLFSSCGRSLITITHYCCGKAKELPVPFGQLAVVIEKTTGSWMLPVIVSVEGHGLHLLTFADNQLCFLGAVVEYILPSVSVLFEKAQKLEEFSMQLPDIIITTVDKLSVRGVVGSIADLWVKYEADLKDQTHKVLRMTQKIPLLSPIARVVNAVATPFASMVSKWMLIHSEAEVKEVFSDDNATKAVVEDTLDDAEHGSVDDHIFLGKKEPSAEICDAITSKDDQNFDKISQEDEKKSQEADERKGVLAPIKVSDSDSETSADPIIELFDTSWHMKPSMISLKAGLSPKQKSRK